MANSFSKKNSFFGGAAILTVGIVIVKLIGALYKIPLGNIISEAAFADFNTAYYIYSLLIIISTCRTASGHLQAHQRGPCPGPGQSGEKGLPPGADDLLHTWHRVLPHHADLPQSACLSDE